ncbi:hypothetical protein [Halorubrum tebenquichense]|uniref:hypothetical protein n=1 Tax=Halorubrum tebenquichense TaxID=119434 RepID=UPI0012684866|nr:hypothetical protein [Halorubrum tebenquichense]
MAIEINTIGLFHCRAESKAVTNTIRIIEKDKIGDYSTVEDVTRKMIGRLIGKDFVDSKSARVHDFTPQADDARDVDGHSTKDLLDTVLNRTGDITEDLETLASWYLQTDYAQSGLLLIAHITTGGRPQLAFIKAPFMDDAYEPDENRVLTEMDQVIKGDLKKGILYPRITPAGDVRKNQACVYQSQSSQRYPKHWYQYLHLEPSMTADEELSNALDSDEESQPLSDPTSTEEFDEIERAINPELKDAVITIEIAGMEVDVRLGELLRRERVFLVENDSGYHLIISGDKPKIKFYDGSEGRYRELLPDLDSYDQLEKVE